MSNGSLGGNMQKTLDSHFTFANTKEFDDLIDLQNRSEKNPIEKEGDRHRKGKYMQGKSKQAKSIDTKDFEGAALSRERKTEGKALLAKPRSKGFKRSSPSKSVRSGQKPKNKN